MKTQQAGLMMILCGMLFATASFNVNLGFCQLDDPLCMRYKTACPGVGSYGTACYITSSGGSSIHCQKCTPDASSTHKVTYYTGHGMEGPGCGIWWVGTSTPPNSCLCTSETTNNCGAFRWKNSCP